MGTPEIEILRSLCKNSVQKSTELHSWLDRFGAAFLDVTRGLGKENDVKDISYIRKKIASYFLVKYVECKKSIVPFHSIWKDLRDSCDFIPILTSNDFFKCISFLGLGSEITSIVSCMDADILEVVMQDLCDWLNVIINDPKSIEFEDVVMLTTMLASIVVAMTNLSFRGKLLELTVEKCYTLLLPVLENVDSANVFVTVSSTHTKCSRLMIEALQFDYSDHCPKISNAEPADVLYLSRLKENLQGGRKNISENLFQDLISMNSSNKVGNGRKNSSPEESPCIVHAKVALNHFHAFNLDKMLKETINSLEQLLSSDGSDKTPKTDDITKTSSDSHDMFVVTHCLDGYADSASRLLCNMMEIPMGDERWKDIIACFQSSPECLAMKCNLTRILDAISRCATLERASSYPSERLTVALELQRLFWKGYIMLPTKSKCDLTKEIIFFRKDFDVLSEYAIKNRIAHTPKHIDSDFEKQKMTRIFFEKLDDQETLSDSVRSEFSYICLQCPLLTLERLIANAFYNRMKLFPSLLHEWDYLLRFPYSPDVACAFWTKFCDCLQYYSAKEDGKSLDNGIYLIESLFEKFSTNKSEEFQNFIKEGFNLFVKSVEIDSDFDSVTKSLHLRLLLVFCESSLFSSIMEAVKLLSLCITLATKIDASSTSWLSSPTYIDNGDLLDDIFVALLEVVTGQIVILKGDNCNEFTMISRWLPHIINDCTWTTQLRLLPVLQLIDGFQLEVPACLKEVCEVPPIFQASTDLCYGTGTGLLAWHQCFVINSNLCPIHSLDINFLEIDDTKLFTAGWIVTLSQILPFCKTRQWLKLIEATKVLISECKLYCPYQCSQVLSLPNINVPDVSTLLGVVQVIKGVFDILCNTDCVDWYSKLSFIHMTRCFSEVSSWLISNSPEFAKAELPSQTFILSQIFCSVCYITKLVQTVEHNNAQSCMETFFILCLDLLGTFERTSVKICDSTKSSDESLSSSCSQSSDAPSAYTMQYHAMELSSRIQDMVTSTSYMPEEQRGILTQKLCMLNKKMQEI